MFSIRPGFLLIFSLFAASRLLAQSPSQAGEVGSALQPSNRKHYVGLPLAFESNRGQAAQGVDFVARGQGYSAQLRPDRVTLDLSRAVGDAPTWPKTAADEVIEITLAGANRHARAVGEDKLPGHSNYLFGSNSAAWITDVEQYAKVRYANVYPGIDIVFHGNQSRLEHDFFVRPGADPYRITLDFSGVQRTALSNSGDLLLRVADGEVQLQRPRAYQVVGGKEVEVSARYVVTAKRTHLSVGSYDRRRTLIIDPVVVYSTFLGGLNGAINYSTQFASAVAADVAGNLYVTGATNSGNFPVTSGALQTTANQNTFAFVSKINPSGTALVYSTYISGLGPSLAYSTVHTGLAADSSGNVFLAGQGGPGLPISPGSHPFQPNQRDIAVLKLNAAGNGVIFATYFGGSGSLDSVEGLAIDSTEDVYLTGTTLSNDFPLQNPLQATLGSTTNAFVTEFNPTGTGLVYSTYLGETSTAFGWGIGVDASQNAYVVGQAGAGFPTVKPEQPTCSASYECPFAAELSAGGSALLYSTFLGTGSGPYVAALAIALDNSGDAYVTGSAGTEAFVTKLDNTGALKYSTLLDSGLSTNAGVAIGLDLSNNAYIVSTNGFVSEIDSAGSVVSSIYLPGTDDYSNGFNAAPSGPQALAVDPSGNIYVAGVAYAPYSISDQFLGLPVFNALQPNFVGTTGPQSETTDAFIIKISPSAGAAAAVAPSLIQFLAIQQVGTTSLGQGMLLYDLGSDPLTISNVSTTGDFAVQVNDCPTTVAPWTSCGIGVTFTPTATGTRNGSLIITDSSAGSPHTVALSGQGGQPTVAVMPSSLNFSSQAVGTTSARQEVTLIANGGINVQISRIDITGDFAETNVNCSLLNAQDQAPCDIFVTFTPTATGPRSGTLTVIDSAINSPQVISLTGTGAPSGLGLGVATGASNSATVAAGTTAKYSLSIGGAGMSGTASLSCTGAPPGATCTVPATEAVSATTATDFHVSVTTTPRTAAALWRGDFQRSPWLWALGLMGWLVLPRTETARRSPRRYLRLVPLLLLVLLCSCGGSSNSGGNSGGTPAGTYTLTVTATVGSTSQPMQLTLAVQ